MHARGGWSSGAPPPFLAGMYSTWLLRIRDAWVQVPLLPYHGLDTSHQGLRLPCAGSTSHAGDNGALIRTLPDSQGLGGVQVMMCHKVGCDLLVLGRQACSHMWFLPSGIEQHVPCLPRPYLAAQRPDRCLIGQDTAPILVLPHNGRFVRTNYGHHGARGAITVHFANEVRVPVRCGRPSLADPCPIHG